MKFIHILGSNRFVYKWNGTLEPFVPTEEDREKLHRMAEAYDEAEHERVVRLAFPSPRPESS